MLTDLVHDLTEHGQLLGGIGAIGLQQELAEGAHAPVLQHRVRCRLPHQIRRGGVHLCGHILPLHPCFDPDLDVGFHILGTGQPTLPKLSDQVRVNQHTRA